MSNLLSICTRVLEEIGSFDVPTFIVDNEDDTAKQLLALAKRVGEELVRDYDWQELSKLHSFTTVNGTSTYALPSDYERIASDTLWDTDSYRRAVGHLTRRKWSAVTSTLTPTSNAYLWQLRGNFIELYPTPGGSDDLTLEYYSKNYCETSGGTDQSEWVSDTDMPLLPSDLFIAGVKYYFTKANNLPYSDAEAEYDWIIQKRQTNNTPTAVVDLAINSRRSNRSYTLSLNIPDTIDT